MAVPGLRRGTGVLKTIAEASHHQIRCSIPRAKTWPKTSTKQEENPLSKRTPLATFQFILFSSRSQGYKIHK